MPFELWQLFLAGILYLGLLLVIATGFKIEIQISLDEYFISFVKKIQPRYNETELVRMLAISRIILGGKRQPLEVPSRK